MSKESETDVKQFCRSKPYMARVYIILYKFNIIDIIIISYNSALYNAVDCSAN